MLVGKTHTMTEDDIIARRVADRLLDIRPLERTFRNYISQVAWETIQDTPRLWDVDIAVFIRELGELTKLGVPASKIHSHLRKLRSH